MHSRIFPKCLSVSLRAGFVSVALTSAIHAGENIPYQPMSGACFVHDSGLEYIPSRLLGVQDIAAAPDRGNADAWTCTDVESDCAVQAERYVRQQAAIEPWYRVYSLVDSLRTWTSTALSDGVAKSLQRWNSNVAAVGCGLAHRVSRTEYDDQDCVWDRSSAAMFGITAYNDGIPGPRIGRANVFVFTLRTEAANPSQELGVDTDTVLGSAVASSEGEREVHSLRGTTFARDYCVFAPYPLNDDLETDKASIFEGTITSEVSEALRLQQRAAVDLQRSASRTLARGMSWLGLSLVRWSEALDQSVRVAEAFDASDREDWK
jgi:hypothetical protein